MLGVRECVKEDGVSVPGRQQLACESLQRRQRRPSELRTGRNLGLCYEFGQGVAQYYKEARRLFALSLKLGETSSNEDLKRIDEKIRAEIIRKLSPLGSVLLPTVKIGDAGLSTQVRSTLFEDLIFGQVSK